VPSWRRSGGETTGDSLVSAECKRGSLTEREARGVLTRLSQKAEHVRRERFCPVAGGIKGKDRLREEGFLVYDLADIEAACIIG